MLGAGCLAAFSLFLHELGLAPLPSSVLVKSAVAEAGVRMTVPGLMHMLFGNLAFNLTQPAALPVMMLAVALSLGLLCGPGVSRVARPCIVYGLFVIFAHLACGQFGSFSRYEIYVLVAALSLALSVHAPMILAWAIRAPAWQHGCVTLIVLILMSSYVRRAVETPMAARDIYE